MISYKDKNYKNGYVALLSVLLISAIGVSITLSLILLGISSSRTSFSLEQSKQANALVNACFEEGLQQIKDLVSYTGSGNITLGQGNCTYTVTSQGGQNRTIISTGTVGNVVRKGKVIISAITPNINVTSWQEVSSF